MGKASAAAGWGTCAVSQASVCLYRAGVCVELTKSNAAGGEKSGSKLAFWSPGTTWALCVCVCGNIVHRAPDAPTLGMRGLLLLLCGALRPDAAPGC